ncbi:MAG: DUF4956 domain-containing protein [Lachnospiraceae bacterium]|nr:DUF4956 domain-containing protein [Lachnospiraceae bacterium]
MTFKDAIRDNLLRGFGGVDMSSAEIILAMTISFVLAMYLFMVYRLITKNGFYSKSFNITMAAISLITCGIIIAMQSSLVISLGMVGALSIVRFRTAIKEPVDLLFLFWSIGTGIICGTGLYKVAVIVAACVTVAIMIMKLIPEMRTSNILFISSSDNDIEVRLIEIINSNTTYSHVKSRNMTKDGVDIVYEVRTGNPAELLKALNRLDSITGASLIEHEGEFRG